MSQDSSNASPAATAAWQRRIRDVLPVLQLPLLSDETIDFATLRDEVAWVFSRGAQGVTVAMVTEILRMSTDERMRVAETVCRAAEDLGPTVISVGAESSFVANRLAMHAEAVGASAVMATQPISTAPLRDECLRYFGGIVESVTLPVIVQDASGYVGRPLGAALQAEILERFGEDRIAFKPEAAPLGPQLEALRVATGGRATVFEGSGGGSLVEAFGIGLHGTMPGTDLIDGVVALWSALARRDNAAIRALADPLEKLVAQQRGLDGFLAVEKHLLVRQGVFRSAAVRGPVSFRLDDAGRNAVDELFIALQTAVAAHQSPTPPSS